MKSVRASKKGAAGIMQLMPATAVGFGVGNRFLVQKNIRGGGRLSCLAKAAVQPWSPVSYAAYYVGEYTI